MNGIMRSGVFLREYPQLSVRRAIASSDDFVSAEGLLPTAFGHCSMSSAAMISDSAVWSWYSMIASRTCERLSQRHGCLSHRPKAILCR